MLKLLQINVASVAVLGKFNPIIFQPGWMAFKGMIGEKEAEGADVEIIHRDIVRFKLDWVEIEVTPERFHAKSSKEAYFEPLRDLVESIFNVLNEIPVNAFGINHTMHLKFHTDADFAKFGNFLAPLSNWHGVFSEPKVLQLEILESKRKDEQDGFLRFKIQSSDLIKPNAIVTNLNNHLNVPSEKAQDMIELLLKNWENSAKLNEEILQDLWKKFKS